jgi:hypothetical protein
VKNVKGVKFSAYQFTLRISIKRREKEKVRKNILKEISCLRHGDGRLVSHEVFLFSNSQKCRYITTGSDTKS